MISLIDIGGNIRKAREKKNFTQEHVAEELTLSRVQYGSIERGENDITITRLFNIAKILGTTVQDLLELPVSDTYMSNNQNSLNDVNDSKIVKKLMELYDDKIADLTRKLDEK